MRMSNLIEDCEDDLEFGDDLEEQMLSEKIIKYPGKTIAIGQKSITDLRKDAAKDALRKADTDPDARCPRGYVRSNGKCVKTGSVSGREAMRSLYNAGNRRAAEPQKKPSLVDRMKAMFGKK